MIEVCAIDKIWVSDYLLEKNSNKGGGKRIACVCKLTLSEGKN